MNLPYVQALWLRKKSSGICKKKILHYNKKMSVNITKKFRWWHPNKPDIHVASVSHFRYMEGKGRINTAKIGGVRKKATGLLGDKSLLFWAVEGAELKQPQTGATFTFNTEKSWCGQYLTRRSRPRWRHALHITRFPEYTITYTGGASHIHVISASYDFTSEKDRENTQMYWYSET